MSWGMPEPVDMIMEYDIRLTVELRSVIRKAAQYHIGGKILVDESQEQITLKVFLTFLNEEVVIYN